MTPDKSMSKPIRSGNIWIGLLLLGALNALFVGLLGFGTRLLLKSDTGDFPVRGVLAFMWGGLFLVLVVPSINRALVALRHGRSTLWLDAAPAAAGGWVSGVVEASDRLHGADIRVFVECIKSWYGGRGTQRHREWQAVKLLDGARLERQAGKVVIPFSVHLPGDVPSTADDTVRRVRLDWRVRVQASVPGVDYEEEFEILVKPKDETAAPESATPPRSMAELRPDQVAARMEAAFEQQGDARVMRLPFPVRTVFLTSLFAVMALGFAVPGLPGMAALDPDARLTLAGVSGFIAAMMLLALSFTGRAIEVRPGAVVLRRGLFGLGFHKTVATRDIVSVEETAVSVEDSIGGYGVSLKLRDGSVHAAVKRLRDPAHARALAEALEAALPKSP